MKVEQIYTSCLAQAAYYIYNSGEAAIIDPLREVDGYIERAQKDGVKIKYIFETHFHADFVSGHVSLSQKTGAKIVYGPNANPKFPAHIAQDNEVFQLGKLSIEALHTPGHTLESTLYLLRDEKGEPQVIFTGDTLFLGDVGRPDLAQKTDDMTKEDLAGMLFDSIREKIMPLPDHIIVYPAHGAGSACGKNMMKETFDTLAHQKQINYALQPNLTREQFIEKVLEGLEMPPGYFPTNVKMNKEGYKSTEEMVKLHKKPLSPQAFQREAEREGVLILDIRSAEDFIQAHIPNSIFIGLDGSFAPWVGELIVDVNRPLLLIIPEGREEEALTRLARIGFDHVLGYLQGGISAWQKANKKIAKIESMKVEDFLLDYDKTKDAIVDLRRGKEYGASHIKEAKNIPLTDIDKHLSYFSNSNKEKIYLHCASGYRSVIGISILKSKGIHGLVNIEGGFKKLSTTQTPRIHIETHTK